MYDINCTIDDDYIPLGDDTDEDNDGELVKLWVEILQLDQELQIGDDKNPILEEDTPETNETRVWYEKKKPLVDHVREKSQDLILFVLGTFLALDRMMIWFMGWSKETHRMKNKPIKEGFKSFILAITTGFVVNFSPDRQTAAKSKIKIKWIMIQQIQTTVK